MKTLFFCTIILISFTHYTIECSLPPIKFKPAYIQAHNPELDQWRDELTKACPKIRKTLLDANPNIECIGSINPQLSEVYRCFEFAIETITGYSGYIEGPEEGNISIDLSNYFQQSRYIQEKNLIAYTTSEQDRTVHHFAVAQNRIRFLSKLGARPEIVNHLPFELFGPYGKAVWSFELKPQYQGQQNKERLLQDIKTEIAGKLKRSRLSRKLVLQDLKTLIERNSLISSNIYYRKFLPFITAILYIGSASFALFYLASTKKYASPRKV